MTINYEETCIFPLFYISKTIFNLKVMQMGHLVKKCTYPRFRIYSTGSSNVLKEKSIYTFTEYKSVEAKLFDLQIS